MCIRNLAAALAAILMVCSLSAFACGCEKDNASADDADKKPCHGAPPAGSPPPPPPPANSN